MITTLAQLTDTVQEAEAEGWVLEADPTKKPMVFERLDTTDTYPSRAMLLAKGEQSICLRVAPWVDQAKMVRRTGR